MVGFTKESDQPDVGSTLDNVLGFKPQAQVSVTGFADWKDWQEQVEAFYRLRPGWGRGKSGDPSAIYYRVKLDSAAVNSSGLASASALGSSVRSSLVLPSLDQYMESGLGGVSFWPRVLARVIDLVVHYLLGIVAGIIFVILLRIAAGGRPPVWVLRRISQTSLELFLSGVVGSFGYQVICTSVSGSTAGKSALSMQVVQDDGSPCRLKSAFIRELGYFVDALFFGTIGYAAMKNDPMQKRHGDDWADTVVSKRIFVPAPARRARAMRFLLGFLFGALADIAFMMLGMLIHLNT